MWLFFFSKRPFRTKMQNVLFLSKKSIYFLTGSIHNTSDHTTLIMNLANIINVNVSYEMIAIPIHWYADPLVHWVAANM